MATVNRQITLASRPVGFPKVSDFHLVYTPLPSPAAGEVLVRSIYLSLDPYMRGRMSDGKLVCSAGRDWGGHDRRSGRLRGGSRGPEASGRRHRPGDAGMAGVRRRPGRELRKIDPSLAPISTALGVLGMPGLTAYFGLLDIGDRKAGETVVVSGAAGAVGMLVGQIAKIKGCRVVGIAGTDDKAAGLLDELGFDAAFNYKTAADCRRQARGALPRRHRRLLRQRGRGDHRRGHAAAQHEGAGIGLRADLAVQPGGARDGAALAGSVDRQAGEGPGFPGVWLRRAVPRRAQATGQVAEAGKAEVPRGRRPGHRKPHRRPSSECSRGRTRESNWCSFRGCSQPAERA